MDTVNTDNSAKKIQQDVENIVQKTIEVKQNILTDKELLNNIAHCVRALTACYRECGKLLLCGNGGSAADAQHIAAELSGRFYFDRPPLYAEALHVNTSYLTAVANDYDYNTVYARMLRAVGRPCDILFAFSTSGNSQNIINAMHVAHEKEMLVVGFTGKNGGKMKDMCDILLNVPSNDTPRIQEMHITIGHIICELVEKELFGDPANR
ncbi:MAG: D-sedoheptulose 7-phosphate isomerase [Bacteroidales bacterium]|jgi:D-sedoheptulose 7-phosphate isomerase|nr:D-sedoheptulose 7-phosphate isomerase [Bacteroidales bacterium]